MGTLHDKAVRLAELAKFIAERIGADPQQTAWAGLLAKCDLLTDMVGEFPQLQGIMGMYYALHDGEPEELAKAIKEQYMPRFSNDELPQTKIGCALALAERFDSLVGIFGINQLPTGEKDPYGLRRAALGIVRIIIKKQFNLSLSEVLDKAKALYSEKLENPDLIAQVKQFILDRMRAWYQEQSVATDVFSAVLARQSTELADFHHRIEAVTAFRQLEEAEALAMANKRVSRILLKEKTSDIKVDPKLFEHDAERELADLIANKQKVVMPLYAEKHYKRVLTELSELRPAIDRYFDNVMVMVEDAKIRDNRLALLSSLRNLFLQVADISLLQ